MVEQGTPLGLLVFQAYDFFRKFTDELEMRRGEFDLVLDPIVHVQPVVHLHRGGHRSGGLGPSGGLGGLRTARVQVRSLAAGGLLGFWLGRRGLDHAGVRALEAEVRLGDCDAHGSLAVDLGEGLPDVLREVIVV